MTVQAETETQFSTHLAVLILVRPRGSAGDWVEFDQGPGVFHIPPGLEVAIQIKGIGDEDLIRLVDELTDCPAVTTMLLAENRRITDRGLEKLTTLTQLTHLNLGACDISNHGLANLKNLPHLTYLDLCYCNRLTDPALIHLRGLTQLTYLNLQGCGKLTTAGLIRMSRRGLTIHRR